MYITFPILILLSFSRVSIYQGNIIIAQYLHSVSKNHITYSCNSTERLSTFYTLELHLKSINFLSHFSIPKNGLHQPSVVLIKIVVNSQHPVRFSFAINKRQLDSIKTTLYKTLQMPNKECCVCFVVAVYLSFLIL